MQLPQAAPQRFVEHEGYLVQYLPESGVDGLRSFHFVVKRSFAIQPDAPAQPLKIQRAMVTTDSYYEEESNPLTGTIRYESELGPPKPACDVILNGHCYPPGGEAKQLICSLRIADLEKRILVLGDRSVWKLRGKKRVYLEPARPFSLMALRWENSYGGVDKRAATGPMPHPANPAGKGYWACPAPGQPETDRWGPLPNLEDPERPIQLDELLVTPSDWAAGPQPRNFAWLPKHWAPRSEKLGFDPQLRSLWELLHGKASKGSKKPPPFKELDPSFFNGAPEDQQIPYPQGGEQLILNHLHPTHEQLRFRLPSQHPRLRWDCGTGKMLSVSLNLDTVLIEPDLMALDLVWRGQVPAPTGFDLRKLKKTRIEIDGELTLPAILLDKGFPSALITEGKT